MDLLAASHSRAREWNGTSPPSALRSSGDRGVDGSGIVVGGADTGVDWTHPALQSKYRGAAGGAVSHDYNWYDPWDDSAAPWDDVGHGTYTLGTVLGQDGDGEPDRDGARRAVDRLPQHALRDRQSGKVSFLHGILPGALPARGRSIPRRAAGSGPARGQQLLGLPEPGRLRRGYARPAFQNPARGGDHDGRRRRQRRPGLRHAGRSARQLGRRLHRRARTTRTTRWPSFPAAGPPGEFFKPDITAPGWMVRSSIPGGKYTISAGTSIAAPHVTGAVALLWSAFPELIGDIDRTEEILRRSAYPVTAGQVCGRVGESGHALPVRRGFRNGDSQQQLRVRDTEGGCGVSGDDGIGRETVTRPRRFYRPPRYEVHAAGADAASREVALRINRANFRGPAPPFSARWVLASAWRFSPQPPGSFPPR